MLVSICIATFKRQEYLANLLDKISTQNISKDIEVNVAVVDNDSSGSGREVVEKFLLNNPGYKIVYEIELQRGIPFTRNRAVSLVSKNTDFVVFIDDDEYPEENWLTGLLKTQKLKDADVVSGPAFPIFINKPASWIHKGKYFVRPHYSKLQTGDSLYYLYMATNNVLIKYSRLMSLEGPFDENLGLSGSDDSDLAYRLNEMGCKMYWTNEAVVWEWIPDQRANLTWILQRAYRFANSNWFLSPNKNMVTRLKIIIGGLGRIAVGAILFFPSLLCSLIGRFDYCVTVMRIIVRGVGMIAGAIGYSYEEYKHFYTHQ